MPPNVARESWVLVADAGQARIFSAARDNGSLQEIVLQEIVDFEERGRSDPDNAGYTDRPGRVQESASTARHGMEPRTDDHTLRAKRFAGELAEFLLAGLREGRYGKLITIAPPRFASMLDDELDDSVKACRTHSEHKDLVHESAADLAKRLANSL